MQETGMWNRMRRLLAGGPKPAANRKSSDSASGGQASLGKAQKKESALTQAAPLGFRSTPSSADQLQGTYQRLVDLVDSIQRHQTSQDQRASQIADSLMQMAETLSDIREKNAAQIDTLSRVADQLSASNERASRWEERIADLPELMASQRDAVLTVAKQMENAGQRDENFLRSLSSFEEAVGALGDATTASSVAIKNLQVSTLESDERVASLLKEQNRRFVMLFGLTLVLIAAAVAAPFIANILK